MADSTRSKEIMEADSSTRGSANLNWSTIREKLDAFTRFFDDNNSLDSMIGWLKEAIQVQPKSYSDFFVYCTLTGLRASEAIEFVILLIYGPTVNSLLLQSRAPMSGAFQISTGIPTKNKGRLHQHRGRRNN